MLLALLLALDPALACDPVPWEVDFAFPQQGAFVDSQAQPLVHVYTSGVDTVLTLEGPGGEVPGVLSVLESDGRYTELMRFAPHAELAPGEYTLTLEPDGFEGPDEVRTFTVSDSVEPVAAVPVDDLWVELLRHEPLGDSCDERATNVLDLRWDGFGAESEEGVVALTISDSLNPDEGYLQALGPERLTRNQREVRKPGGEHVLQCVEVTSWGSNASLDAVSEEACVNNWEDEGDDEIGGNGIGRGGNGCACSSASSLPAGLALVLPLLGLAWARRRR